MTESTRHRRREVLRRALTTAIPEGELRFAVAGPAFLRLRAEGTVRLRVEAPGNEILPPESWIGVPEVEALERRGFALPRDPEVFFARVVLVDEESSGALAAELESLLAEVYDMPPQAEIHLVDADASVDRPANAALARELRRYRETPSEEGWDALCAALLDAELMIAVEPSPLPGEPPRARPVHDEQGHAAVAAFLGHLAARRAAPRGLQHISMPGAAFVLWLDEQGSTRVVIDPAGPVPLQLGEDLLSKLARSARELRP